ncbi:MAG: hypothetical protein K8R34_16775 [Methanosarcinales archaeon]|nr:hypothetical protein [Methanosarcinales archaeon]MCD4809929.1 hypothetical protein [Methanosarcinales archaeon]
MINKENSKKDLEKSLLKLTKEYLPILDNFKDLQIIKRVQLQSEAEIMSKKLGKDHPRTQQLNARLKKNLDIINALVVEGQIARIKVPEISGTDTLIHGRVTDRNYRGIWGVNTCLADADEHIFSSLGIPNLDDTGYYSFVIDKATFKEMSDVFEKEIFLAICSKKCKVIHRKCEPIKITKGETLLVDLILDREELSKGREVREKPDTGEDKDDSKSDSDAWIVSGQVIDEDEHGIKGLSVRFYNKDNRYDDKIGSALTDDRGNFKIIIKMQDFRKGQEPGPDLYLNVRDSKGNTLFTSEKAVRYDAGHEEVFNVTIKK